jgi:hypothetical protein
MPVRRCRLVSFVVGGLVFELTQFAAQPLAPGDSLATSCASAASMRWVLDCGFGVLSANTRTTVSCGGRATFACTENIRATGLPRPKMPLETKHFSGTELSTRPSRM